MEYYQLSCKGGYIGESKDLSMLIADEADGVSGAGGKEAVFGIEHRFCSTYTEKINPVEPIKLFAHYYIEGEEVIETDLVCVGTPLIVTEDFKNLVEELDPGCAQFFTTEGTNYKPQKKYFVMHVTKTVDTIRHGWQVAEDRVGENDHVFRVKKDPFGVFVSEKFRKEFKKRKMTGVVFLS